ncbi:MAG: aminoacyl-tRNA hydrolase [Oscillospiraceae bacterium]|jgi:PTH1 family peptidyl-tRNA hydrolase|nr:aminoacyl-tRNA hydrolase [Oscillospiraceae bacterium]
MFFKKREGGFTPEKLFPNGVSWIIAGLGNPGARHEGSRHNIGFMAIDKIAENYKTKINRLKFRALTAAARIRGMSVLLIKPQTFMNLSGESIKAAACFYKVPPERIIVLSDDVLLDVGRMRVRRKGSDGGHNGLKSIISELDSENFPRIRMGVGQKPHPDYDLADWVLGKFSKADLLIWDGLFDEVSKAAEMIVCGDIEGAMSAYNAK